MSIVCENAFSIKVRIIPTYQNPIRFHQVFHGRALSQKLWIGQNLKIKLHVPIFEIYRLLCTHKQAHMKSKLNILIPQSSRLQTTGITNATIFFFILMATYVYFSRFPLQYLTISKNVVASQPKLKLHS